MAKFEFRIRSLQDLNLSILKKKKSYIKTKSGCSTCKAKKVKV
jgi:hypothetical protein